jgi:hypothetical protein
MKLLEVFNIINEAQFLIERDVLNAKELKAWVQQSAERVQQPQSKTWFASQLYKFLINRYQEGARPLTQPPADAPEWLLAKMQAGEPVLSIEPQQELRQEVEGVVDWLNAESKADLRMTWEQAAEFQKEWHSEIKRASRVTELTPEEMEGLVTIKEYDNGFKWVDVQTEVCLKHEGTTMGHCVGQGGYTTGVKEGTTKIISLRDAKGLAHATIEGQAEHPITINPSDPNQLDLFRQAGAQSMSDMTVHQIKGKENKGVVAKYRDYVQDFLTTFQIDKFTHYALSDLESSGLFKLRKGGYAPVDKVGKKMADVGDGTSWSRVSNELVELQDYSGELDAKWFLQDKGGRSMADAQEKVKGTIDSVSMPYGEDKKKYQEHVKALFGTGIKPGESMYSDHGGVHHYGLAIDTTGTVDTPNKVGEEVANYDGGSIYATAGDMSSLGLESPTYWLMQGDQIVSRFSTRNASQHAGQLDSSIVTLSFDKEYGIPRGSMVEFLDEIQKVIENDIERIQIQGRSIDIDDLTWKPGPSDEQVLEQDDVLYYADKRTNETHYRAIDSHGHILFTMVYQDGKGSFSPIMVSDPKVAGFYAIYLIEHLELDIGENRQYNSFAREFLNETDWFVSDQYRHNDEWRVMNDEFPIIYSVVAWDLEGESTFDREKEETTMSTFWSDTSLDSSGMEEDFFANMYDMLYNGGTAEWDEEHDTGDEEETRSSTNYYAESNGDVDTVTHPVSGGTMKVTR